MSVHHEGERYAVVSCHVERPLDDRVWRAFSRLQARAPGGFRIAALMRPPDGAAREDEETWLERAREAAVHGPLGHHTHFGGPDTARPPAGVDAVARFRGEVKWLQANGVRPRFYCAGGWYLDAALAAEIALAGYVDCSAVSFSLPWLGAGDPRARLVAPARLEGLLEIPTTHSLGSAARALARLPDGVHVHFHDWELTSPRRRLLLTVVLTALARLRPVRDLDEVASAVAEAAPAVSIESVLGA